MHTVIILNLHASVVRLESVTILSCSIHMYSTPVWLYTNYCLWLLHDYGMCLPSAPGIDNMMIVLLSNI